MRGRLEVWARRWWSGRAGVAGAILSLLTLPAECLFRGLVRARDTAYRRGWLRTLEGPVPVVSVGNLTLGGTGKTPVAAWIAAELLDLGARPALVARGYGADELALHRRWNPQVPVVADPRRWRGVREAARRGADVAILDDGFQHRALARDLDVVLLSAEDPLPPRLLPRGPYREGLKALRRAQFAVVTHRTATIERVEELEATIHRACPELPLARARLGFGGWADLSGAPSPPPEGSVLALASVARPDSFVRMVREATGRDPELLAFPDHHRYTAAQVRAMAGRAGGRAVVTTEKDAVKLEAFRPNLSPEVRVLKLRLELGEGVGALREALAGLRVR